MTRELIEFEEKATEIFLQKPYWAKRYVNAPEEAKEYYRMIFANSLGGWQVEMAHLIMPNWMSRRIVSIAQCLTSLGSTLWTMLHMQKHWDCKYLE